MQLLRKLGEILLAGCFVTHSTIAASSDACPSKAYIWDNLQVGATPAGQEQMQVRVDSDTVYVNITADDEKTLKALYEFRKACNNAPYQYLCTCHIEQGAITPGNICKYTDIKVKVDIHMLPESCEGLLKMPCSETSTGCNFSLTETKPMEPLDPAMRPINPQPKPLFKQIKTPEFKQLPGNSIFLGENEQQPFFVLNDCAGGADNKYCVNSELATQAFATTAKDGTAWGGARNNLVFDECKPGGPDGVCRLTNPVDALTLKQTATLLDNNQFEITYIHNDNPAFSIKSSNTYPCDLTEHGGSREFKLDSDGNIHCILKP